MSKPVFKATGQSGNYTAEFKAGEMVFDEGDLGTDMFIIHEGQIEILKRVGSDLKQLAVLEKGDFFGEMSLLDDMPRNAAARALNPAKLVRINGATFAQMLRKDPEIAVRIMRKFSRRLRETDTLLKKALGTTESSAGLMAEMPAPDIDKDKKYGPERLVHVKSGMEFLLAQGEETTVGRRDPVTGIYPDVDLTPVDTQRSTSRRHSKVYRRAGKFYASEEIGTMNGTFVNGTRLETGVPVEVKDQDELRFGVVNMTFHIS